MGGYYTSAFFIRRCFVFRIVLCILILKLEISLITRLNQLGPLIKIRFTRIQLQKSFFGTRHDLFCIVIMMVFCNGGDGRRAIFVRHPPYFANIKA